MNDEKLIWESYQNMHPYYYGDGFDEGIKSLIEKNKQPCTLACQNESVRWFKLLIKLGVDADSITICDGFFNDEDNDIYEGHTWLEVNGSIFDPTADQFDGEKEDYMYESIESWDGEDGFNDRQESL